jgi:hypothetical protein
VSRPCRLREFSILRLGRIGGLLLQRAVSSKSPEYSSFPFEIAMIRASESREVVHEWSDHNSDLLCARKGSEFEAGGFRQL